MQILCSIFPLSTFFLPLSFFLAFNFFPDFFLAFKFFSRLFSRPFSEAFIPRFLVDLDVNPTQDGRLCYYHPTHVLLNRGVVRVLGFQTIFLHCKWILVDVMTRWKLFSSRLWLYWDSVLSHVISRHQFKPKAVEESIKSQRTGKKEQPIRF